MSQLTAFRGEGGGHSGTLRSVVLVQEQELRGGGANICNCLCHFYSAMSLTFLTSINK